MKAQEWWKTGGMCGFFFVLLFVVGFLIQAGGPAPDDSATEIRKYFADSGNKYMVGDIMFAVGFVFFFIPFVGLLSSFMDRRDIDGAGWARLLPVYGAAMLALGASVSGLQGALAYGAANQAEDGLVRFLVDATYYANMLAFSLIAAGFVLTVSIGILRTGLFWKWLGWFGLLVTALAVIGSLSVFSSDPMGPLGGIGLLGLIGWGIFNLALSYGLWSADGPPAPVNS